MNERKSGFDKNAVLKALSDSVKKADSLPEGEERDAYDVLADRYFNLAEEMGATNFEITDAYFSATEQENRQGLFDTYCQQLWVSCDEFGSYEELRDWADDMIKIRDKYKLQDTLAIVKEYCQSGFLDDDSEVGLLGDFSQN
jgi:hypothetical protein